MGNSIFNIGGGTDQYHGGSFRAEDVKLEWTGVGGVADGALVQEAQWRCARQVSILYEIGSPAVYYVGNRRSGNAQMRRVVGGAATFAAMAKHFGNICKPENLIINAKQEPCGKNVTGGGVKYTCVDATLNDLGASMQAESVVINESMSFVFVDLYYE
jgi:hypothetical protein